MKKASIHCCRVPFCGWVLGHTALLSQLADFLDKMFSQFRFPGLFHHITNDFINILIEMYIF